MAKFLLPAALVCISPNALQGSDEPLTTIKGDLLLQAGGTIPESDAQKVNILLTLLLIHACVWLYNITYNVCTGTLKIVYP